MNPDSCPRCGGRLVAKYTTETNGINLENDEKERISEILNLVKEKMEGIGSDIFR